MPSSIVQVLAFIRSSRLARHDFNVDVDWWTIRNRFRRSTDMAFGALVVPLLVLIHWPRATLADNQRTDEKGLRLLGKDAIIAMVIL